MLVFDRAQRRLLAETFRDIANIGAGAMVFGQFVSGQRFSLSVAMFGGCIWVVLAGFAVHPRERQQVMTGLYVMFGIIVLFATIVVVLDAIGRRQQRKAGKG